LKMDNWVEKFLDEFKKLVRRSENTEKTVNLIYKDRDLLEQISIRLGTAEDEIKQLRDRISSLEKNTKADIKEMHQKVEDKVETIIDTMEKEVKK